AIELETTTRIAALSREYGKPIVIHSLYSTLHADLRPLPLTRLRQAGIPVHESLEQAVRCLQALASFSEVGGQNQALPAPQSGETEMCADLIKICRREQRTLVLEHEARQLLKRAGVTMPPAQLVVDADTANDAFAALGRVPVAMKIVSRDIIHKSDSGGVRLNIDTAAAAKRAFNDIMANARCAVADVDISGVL